MSAYRVVRRFTGGNLAGLTYTSVARSSPPAVGWRCDEPCGGSPYVIESVTSLDAAPCVCGPDHDCRATGCDDDCEACCGQ